MPVGEFEVYRRHRLILENWAKTRSHYQDLVAMILLEVGQRRLIFTNCINLVPMERDCEFILCVFAAIKHDYRIFYLY